MIPFNEIHTLVDFGMCLVLWLVQLVIYPSFLQMEDSRLVRWHKAYTFRVSFIIIPLMFTQLAFSIYSAYVLTDARNLIVLGLVLLSWVLTFFVSVPLHNRISHGELDSTVRQKLIKTNWPRTIIWSVIFAVGWGESF